MSTFSNDNHPEIRDGEVFHCNTANPTASQVKADSRRVGVKAYDLEGNVIEGLSPVFISHKDEAKILIKQIKGLQSNFDFFSNERKLCFRMLRILNRVFNKGVSN